MPNTQQTSGQSQANQDALAAVGAALNQADAEASKPARKRKPQASKPAQRAAKKATGFEPGSELAEALKDWEAPVYRNGRMVKAGGFSDPEAARIVAQQFERSLPRFDDQVEARLNPRRYAIEVGAIAQNGKQSKATYIADFSLPKFSEGALVAPSLPNVDMAEAVKHAAQAQYKGADETVASYRVSVEPRGGNAYLLRLGTTPIGAVKPSVSFTIEPMLDEEKRPIVSAETLARCIAARIDYRPLLHALGIA